MDVVVRPLQPDDRSAVVALASRLTIGVAQWRDTSAVAAATHSWLDASTSDDFGGEALVACTDQGVVGFVSLSTTTHFGGERDAYIGELVVDASAEGNGVGAALVAAVERLAAARGHRCITLSTGAANVGAIRFYTRLGYRAEDVKLTKLLDG